MDTAPNVTVAVNAERARCAQVAINFLMDAGADEAQAHASPLVVAILRPAPVLIGMDLASGADQSHYAPQGWQDSLRQPDDPKTLAAETRPNSLLGDA